ncbi:hypothetical protein LIER_00467 [Lithospermum erythrorhizon]|uniref:DUF4283 domain-containing protein n=1 Tax=Lithospermum erythrorhizon TaxID=34254 RepID=A0AAV3NHG1_LITER
MDSKIIRNLLKCNLTNEESRPIQLKEVDLVDGISECEASAFAKVLSLRDGFISIQNFTLIMAKAWNCKGLRVSRAVHSILHIFFPSLEEKKCIMGWGPWCFENQLVLMKDWGRNVDPLQIDFSEYLFWIQLCGLRDETFTKDVGFKLASAFDSCEGVELRKDKMGKKFFRIRVTCGSGTWKDKVWASSQLALNEDGDSLGYSSGATILKQNSRNYVSNNPLSPLLSEAIKESNGPPILNKPILKEQNKRKTVLGSSIPKLYQKEDFQAEAFKLDLKTIQTEEADLIPILKFFNFQKFGTQVTTEGQISTMQKGKAILKGPGRQTTDSKKRFHPYVDACYNESQGKKPSLSNPGLDGSTTHVIQLRLLNSLADENEYLILELPGLLEWKRDVMGNVQHKIESKQATLDSLNQRTITNVSKEQALTLAKEIDKLCEANDVYWRQRSRVEWRVKGDRNTSYFHALSSQRGKMTLITALQDENGTMVTNAYDIQQLAAEF